MLLLTTRLYLTEKIVSKADEYLTPSGPGKLSSKSISTRNTQRTLDFSHRYITAITNILSFKKVNYVNVM